MWNSSFQRVVFFHVPKTAGTSLGEYLRQQYPADQTWIQSTPTDFSFRDEGIGRYSYVSGHIPLGDFLDDFSDPSWLKIVVLRSPLTHLPSRFYYHQSVHHHIVDPTDLDLFHRACRMSLTEFLEQGDDEEFITYFDNPQIRFLLGMGAEPITDAHVTEAIHLLDRCEIVGLRERLLPCAQLIARELGREIPSSLPTLRTGQNNPFRLDLAERSAIAAISARTVYDEQIFRWAIRRFDDQLRAFDLAIPSVDVAPDSSPCFLYDVVRSLERDVVNARWGQEARLINDQIILHPPAPDVGSAEIRIKNMPLAGQRKLSARLVVPDPNGPVIVFSIALHRDDVPIFETSHSLPGGSSSEITGLVPAIFGNIELVLRTKVAPPAEHNFYATAIFEAAQVL
jgi:hypothetical protein